MSGSKKSRKRTRNPKKHKAYVKKQKVQKGDEHTTNAGNVMEKKIFQSQSTCPCKRKCPQNINCNRQKEIFDSYYKLQNWTEKTLYLRSLTKTTSAKENLNPIISLKQKKIFNNYYLSDESGVQHQVCLAFLLNCVQINRSRLFNAVKTKTSNENAKDNRGNRITKKTNEDDIAFAMNFISSFPTYESHYKISQSNKKYLSPFLTIKRMYREYCLKCNFEQKKPLSEWKFSDIFNTEFNLSFARLKVDTCRKCDMLNASIKSAKKGSAQQIEAEMQKRAHLELVEKTKNDFDATLKYASNPENKTVMFTFDLQKALEMPVIQTSEVYYMRQLWLYNCGVYDEVNKTCYMYNWNESTASRGSQEIGSCLYKHFIKFVPKDTQNIILWSDACSGQNRNIKMALMLKKFLCMSDYPDLTSIEQHFFVSGHSYNSCDRSFGLIEKQKRMTESIFVPEHWINVMKQAKKNEPKFVVVEMLKNDFFSSKPLEMLIINRKITTSGEKINWLKVQKITYERFSPFMLDFVNYGADSTITVSLQKKCTFENFSSVELPCLFPEGREINYLKYQDLQKLLKYIPKKYHPFYRSLNHDRSNLCKDYALADRQSSDDDSGDEV